MLLADVFMRAHHSRDGLMAAASDPSVVLCVADEIVRIVVRRVGAGDDPGASVDVTNQSPLSLPALCDERLTS
jgi:hypothetical protein